MRKVILPIVLAFSLAGCAQFSAFLGKVNTAVSTYAPIVGKDLLMIGNILVTAECSPALQSATAVTGNILSIVAPNSKAASNVQNVLLTNLAVSQQLCPFVAAIKASVGPVPSGTPTQVIPASGT